MATPESKVKDKVKKILKEAGAYYFMPPMNGYGSSGVPDIIACLDGHFLGIECKANGNKPTALQEKNLKEIADNGGTAMVVDETGIGVFKMMVADRKMGMFVGGDFYNLSKFYPHEHAPTPKPKTKAKTKQLDLFKTDKQ